MESDSVSYFHIFITGQIESATFPLGADGSQIFCRYEIISGFDWEFLSGNKAGITQSCSATRNNNEIIFNMPIEVCYKSTNPFGWPQIVISVYGKNVWGIETALGYARIHLPTFGNEMKSSPVPILMPKCTTIMAELTRWITGRNPELKNPKILIEGIKTKGLQMESYGQLNLSLRTISRGSTKMGFE